MLNKKRKKLLAFSLVELSITMLIIGVLIVAIASSATIFYQSKISSAQSLTKSSPVLSTDGLLVWLEATLSESFSSGETTDGVTVSKWNDLNPYARTKNNATQNIDADKPLYIKKAINNLPALRFDGSTDYISYDGTGIADSDYTIFVVEQRRSSGVNFFLGGQDASANTNLLLGYFPDDASLTWSQFGPYYRTTVSTYSSPTPRIHAYIFSSTSGKDYYLNGGYMNLTAVGSPVATQGLTSYNGATVGRYVAAGEYYNGDVAELIIFNRALTYQEKQDIETYLSKKWGITLDEGELL